MLTRNKSYMFLDFIREIFSIKFEERPDYTKLVGMLMKIL